VAPQNPTTDAASQSFYADALIRIQNFMLALALALTIAGAFTFGWRIALGFAIGCAISYVNFIWLKRVVTAFGERITQSGAPSSGRKIVLRFLLRYLLMAAGAYAIFSVSPASLNGLFAGLFLPVAAIACEAAYEVYVALARGL
jgi:hypothetical protein